MADLHQQAIDAGITVLNEIGLDPGIDHLYAIKIINEIHSNGGTIDAFESFCGGLPAPEASDNPLGYKFSWSARGVLLALLNDTKYWKDGEIVHVKGENLMKSAKKLETPFKAFDLVGYGNRDSTNYTERYGIKECKTLIRGTLRYACFPAFVQALKAVGLLSLKEKKVKGTWRNVMQELVGEQVEKCVKEKIKGNVDEIMEGFRWLGLFGEGKVKESETLLDALCATLQEKMEYAQGERDMVFLQHAFTYTMNGIQKKRYATLIDYGTEEATSMAKLVGVPCGIAVQLILDGVIQDKGVLAPLNEKLGGVLIEELEREGIGMKERE